MKNAAKVACLRRISKLNSGTISQRISKESALLFSLLLFMQLSYGQVGKNYTSMKHKQNLAVKPLAKPVLPGAYQTKEYLPQLAGQRVGVFANNTSKIGHIHLVDSLRKRGVNITKIFGPEHGFRGNAGAGDKVENDIDITTGIKVISLYGKKLKPTKEDLADVDILLFDIQDVGVRFYTYISSLQYFIESAVENNKPLIILDRPNPNGFYIDGPVLDTAYQSFIGMQAVPVVYGMTIGEYANYIVGEGLLHKEIMTLMMLRMIDGNLDSKSSGNGGLHISVIKCRNYTHSSSYILPEKPSPNLPDENAVLWYPSICFFEGTVISEGRGTDKPFQKAGHPLLPKNMYAFTPAANAGASNPKLINETCYGWDLSTQSPRQSDNNQLRLSYLLDAYKRYPDKNAFFILPKKDNYKPADIFFNKLAGNAELMQQIKDGKTENEIRASWQPKLEIFKQKRKKYLMYEE